MLAARGFVSRIHHRKPKGKAMPARRRIANAKKSRVRSAAGHVFGRFYQSDAFYHWAVCYKGFARVCLAGVMLLFVFDALVVT